jgi:hypothetical protein
LHEDTGVKKTGNSEDGGDY